MKIKLANLSPRAFAQARGKFVIRDTIHGPIAQAWPKKQNGRGTILQQQFRQRFAFAGQMASNPTPLELQTAQFLSKGTDQVPRDLLTMAALAEYYIFQWPDGRQIQKGSSPLANHRRNQEQEMWEWSLGDSAWTGAASATAFATKGLYFIPPYNDNILAVRAIFTAVSGAIYKASLGHTNASHIIQTISSSGPTLSNGAGLQVVQFDLTAQLVANQLNFLVITRTDLLGTTILSVPFQTAPRWKIPLLSPGWARIASVNPLPGNTLEMVATQTTFPLAMLFRQ